VTSSMPTISAAGRRLPRTWDAAKAAWLDLYRVFEPVNAMPLDRGKPRHHLGRGGVG
jgi:hypothetical protein